VPKNYLQVTPVPSKWYVSERVRSVLTAWHPISSTQPQPERSPSLMILAGPFETRDEAKDWNTLASASGYIWEKG
jgi:hypothetical protein